MQQVNTVKFADGMGLNYKQGMGIISLKSFVVETDGDYFVGKKRVGIQNIFTVFTKNYVYTGFNPYLAMWLAEPKMYLASFDYDTDIQLDVTKVLESLRRQERLSPNEKILESKLIGSAMQRAAEKTRKLRSNIDNTDKGFTIGLWIISFFALGLIAFYISQAPHSLYAVTLLFKQGTYNGVINTSQNSRQYVFGLPKSPKLNGTLGKAIVTIKGS